VVGGAIGLAAGAVAGFAGAACTIAIAALAIAGVGKGSGLRTDAATWRTIVLLFLPIAVYQFSLNALMQVDQPLLSANLADLAHHAGAADAADVAAREAGFYRAAQTFAFVPYQLIAAVTFVVFPTVSRATSLGDEAGTRRAIAGAMRFSLIVLCAIAAPIAGAADGVMRIAYTEEYVAGAPALSVLALGLVPFSLFAIGAAILAGTGRVWTVAGLALASACLVITANYVAVRAAGLGPGAAIAAAAATSGACAAALAIVGAVVRLGFGAFLPLAPTLRTIAAAAIAWAVARAIPHHTALLALVACVVGAVGYLIALVLLGEIGREDLALVRRVLGRRGS
jgi:stage V sporulation protein B